MSLVPNKNYDPTDPNSQPFVYENADVAQQTIGNNFTGIAATQGGTTSLVSGTEPVLLSSENAISTLNQKTDTLNKLSPPPAAPTVTDPSKPAPTQTSKVTYINENGQTITVDPNNKDAVNQALNQGYKVESADLTGGTKSDIFGTDSPEIKQAKEEAAQMESDMNSLKTQLSQYTISDADLKAQTDAIAAQWDARIQTMQDINRRRVGAITTTGVRLGDQYTGGMGGMFGGIISEEERQGVQRIADLEAQKQSAINAAKTAARQQNWEVYSKQVDMAENAYNAKLKEIDNLNQAAIAHTKAIQDAAAAQRTQEKDAFDRSLKIADAMAPLVLHNFTGDEAKDSAMLKDLAGQFGLDPNLLLSRAAALQKDPTQANMGQDYNVLSSFLGRAPTQQEYLDFLKRQHVAGTNPSDNGLTPYQVQQTINQISGQFDNEAVVKNYNIVSEGYQFAKTLVNKSSPTASDDQGLIYAFAKAMDPNSVVREGEYATVQKYAQSWAESFGFDAKRIFSNSVFLTKEARQNMLNTIESKFKTSETNYKNIYNEYQRRIQDAKSGKINGSITDYSKAYGDTGGGSPNDLLSSDITDNASNYSSREDLLAALKPLYPEFTTDQIMAEIMKAWPDK